MSFNLINNCRLDNVPEAKLEVIPASLAAELPNDDRIRATAWGHSYVFFG